MGKLEGKKVAALVADGFEQIELTSPMERLVKEGADVQLVSLKPGKVKGWESTDWGKEFDVDKTVDEVSPADFDALLLPGGVMNPDKLRREEKAVEFVRGVYNSGKPIASICHGPWLLAEAGVTDGLHMTSFASIKTDLRNAGADWVDEECVVDRGIVTSRSPNDLDAFNDKMVEEFQEGQHPRNTGVDKLAKAMEASV